jgi:hypothetical protein
MIASSTNAAWARSRKDDKMTKPAIDQMDTGLDFIRVAAMARRSDDWRDEDMIESIRNTIEHGLSALAPVREFVNDLPGAS